LLCHGQLYLGPTLGSRLSTLTYFDDRAKDEYKALPAFGFDVGFMMSRRIKDRFCLNAELIYSQKGKIVKGKTDPFTYNQNGQTKIGNPDPLYYNKQRNHFIELPIYYMLEFKRTVGKHAGMAGQQKAYKWFIGGGPTISYWLGGKGNLQSSWLKEDLIDNLKYKVVFNKDSLKQSEDAHVMNVTGPNRVQFAINLTGGIALEPVGFQKIVIAAHLELGQSFMAKKNPGVFPGSNADQDVLRAKYHSLRLSVSYLFDTKVEDKKRGKSTNKASNKKKRK
jgi:hypothetical protein